MRYVEFGRVTTFVSCVALLAVAGCGGGDSDGGRLVPEFYDPPSPLAYGEAGSVIRTGAVPGKPAGVKAKLIMYHSRTNDGEDIAATGLLMLPSGDPPPGGWPLVAAAHGTTGLIEECAPSIAPFAPNPLGIDGKSYYEFFYKPWLDGGFAVVGPDYQGQGAPGPYSFLVGKVEGQNVLDAVRAARRIEGDLISDQLILFGHSQGGNSAGFAAEILPEYAPELTSSGVILAAPAASLHELLELAYRGGPGATCAFEAVSFLYLASLSYDASYAGLNVYDVIDRQVPAGQTQSYGEQGLPIFTNMCYGGGISFLVNSLPFIRGPSKPGDFFIPLSQYPAPWIAAIDENSLGRQSIDTPILMVQGCHDTTIPVSTNFTYFEKELCPMGEVAEFKTYPGDSHSGVVVNAFPEMLEWAKRRVAGEPAPSNCSVPPTCPSTPPPPCL